MQQLKDYFRFCPDQPKVLISDAVCFGRRRGHYPYCGGCQFNDDEVKPGTTRDEGVQRKHQETVQMLGKVFKAYDVRGTYPDQLNEELAYKIGHATATYLRMGLRGVERGQDAAGAIIVGRDMRKSSPSMSAAFIDGARDAGSPVYDIGMVDTPQVCFAINHLKTCGGTQVTASHNPGHYNGFKISGAAGAPIGGDTGLANIRQLAQSVTHMPSDKPAWVEQKDLSEEYRKFVLSFLKKPKRLRIVVDASNGMAGRWVPIIFGQTDELELICLNLKHDGDFVHEPNPLVDANLDQLRAEVKSSGADFGVCFDGDADRLILVDENADIIRCDMTTALLAKEFLRREPGSTIVYDLRSSRVVAEEVRAAGGHPRRERVGHAFMKTALAKSKGVFGGELSGHFYFKDNFYCDSGMLALVHMVNVLTREDKPLSDLIRPLKRYTSSGERNFVNEHKDETIQRLAEMFKDAKVDFLDGVTVQYDKWWFNVRKSNTEPLLRLNLEAESKALMEEKVALVGRELGEASAH